MKNKVINLFDNTNDDSDNDTKYAEVLKNLVAAFQNNFPDDFDVHDTFELSVNAWNFANMSLLVPEEEFNEIMAFTRDRDIHFELLEKMLEHKVSQFEEYTNFIIDFTLEEVDGAIALNVKTEDEQEYLLGMMEQGTASKELSPDDFEENYIDRYAITITPKQPFFDWLNKLYPESPINGTDEANTYLIDNTIDDPEKWLSKKFDRFFMMELNHWHTDEKEWPQKRSFKRFSQWFHVSISTMVYDTEECPVSKQLKDYI